MLSVYLERLHLQAQGLTAVTSEKEQSRIVERYAAWLGQAIEALNGLRQPFQLVLQSHQSRLRATADGHQPEGAGAIRNQRKLLKQQASPSMAEINRELADELVATHNKLHLHADKVQQALAVLSAKNANLPDEIEVDLSGARRVWEEMNSTAETIAMARYLATALPKSDLNYLLQDAINNLKANLSD